MTGPQVSVIISTFNRAGLLRQAIDSVLRQTMPAFELVVVDDGSTDDTAAAVQGCQDQRVRYIHQTHAGGPAARNRGWQESSAAYILFMDDDDRLLSHALQVLLERAAQVPEAGLIGGDYEYVDTEGNILGLAALWRATERLDLAAWVLFCPFIPSATLVGREWLGPSGGFDPGQEAAQDWDLWLRLVGAGCPATWCKTVVCQYRLHPARLTGDPQRQKRGSLRALDKVFSLPDLPAEVRRLRGEAYGGVYLIAAARNYAASRIDLAQQDLLAAAALMPDWVGSGLLLERLLRRAESPVVTREPLAYAATVQANLPPGLFSARSRRRAQARLSAARLFSDYHDRRWTRILPLWWTAARNDPTWLANRGFVLIGLRALLRFGR